MSHTQYFTQLNQVQEVRSEVSTLEEERSRVIGTIAEVLIKLTARSFEFALNLLD